MPQRRAWRQLQCRHDVSRQQIGARELDRVAYELVGVERSERGLAALEERAKAADHLGGAVVLGYDVVADLAQFGHVEGLSAQYHLRRFGVGEDGRQRLVQLMCDRCGKLPKQRNTRHVAQRRVVLLGLDLGALAQRDVYLDTEQLPVMAEFGAPACRSPEQLAIGARDAVLDIEFFAVVQRLAGGLFDTLAVLWVDASERLPEILERVWSGSVA